jgi:pyruvate/2-oxoglutarate/acetoin dehydrogenase E1 component
MVARFVDRLASLSSVEWESIQSTIKTGGVQITMLDASRNAAVALAVRDLISKTQFDQLYQPFLGVIPLESIEAPPNLD